MPTLQEQIKHLPVLEMLEELDERHDGMLYLPKAAVKRDSFDIKAELALLPMLSDESEVAQLEDHMRQQDYQPLMMAFQADDVWRVYQQWHPKHPHDAEAAARALVYFYEVGEYLDEDAEEN